MKKCEISQIDIEYLMDLINNSVYNILDKRLKGNE
jgi:hypothetical protein